MLNIGNNKIMLNVKSFRMQLKMTQTDFWLKLGVTQSGGSRYETGRAMPVQVAELLRIVYVEKIEISDISAENIKIITHLKTKHPDLYNALSKAVLSLKGNKKIQKTPIKLPVGGSYIRK